MAYIVMAQIVMASKTYTGLYRKIGIFFYDRHPIPFTATRLYGHGLK